MLATEPAIFPGMVAIADKVLPTEVARPPMIFPPIPRKPVTLFVIQLIGLVNKPTFSEPRIPLVFIPKALRNKRTTFSERVSNLVKFFLANSSIEDEASAPRIMNGIITAK